MKISNSTKLRFEAYMIESFKYYILHNFAAKIKPLVREAAKKFFLLALPLRWGGGKGLATKKKELCLSSKKKVATKLERGPGH